MNDLFQVVPLGAMLLAVAEHSPCKDSALHFAVRIEDVVTKLTPQGHLHVCRQQDFMPELIGVNDMDVGLRRHPPHNGTFPRADSTDYPHHRDAVPV